MAQTHPTTVTEAPAFVAAEPTTQEQPKTTYVKTHDPAGKAMAASTVIQTLVWSGVTIVLLVVGILLLLHWHIL